MGLNSSNISLKVVFKLFRNDNDVKNRFYCCLKKVLKRINSIQKAEKLKPKKPLGLDSLLTVLEIGKWNQNTTDKRFL